MLGKVIILVLVLVAQYAQTSSSPKPRFPRKFAADYKSPTLKTTGTFHLDEANQKITFMDSTNDHLCSTFINGTKCTNLVTNGFRYLIFEEKEFCCKCCAYSIGTYECGGPLSPKWVKNYTGNLQYLGVEEILGEKCYKWNAHAAHDPNYYFEFVGSRKPCGIRVANYLRFPWQHSDNYYQFSEESVDFGFDSKSVFRVPEICKSSNYCGGGVCAEGPAKEDPLRRMDT